MKVIVTGGTGFIGANVVRHLLARGDEVVCLTRASSPPLCLEGLDVKLVNQSLTDVEGLARVLEGAGGVYHIAGIFDPGPDGADKMRSVHVDATEALCQASQKAGVRRVLVCSSSVTIGYGPRDRPGDEDSALDPTPIYGRSGALRTYFETKLEGERVARRWADKGLETVIVNPDFIIGAWDIKPTSGAMVVNIAKRWVPVYPRGGKCFQDADDCALGHLYAMDRGTPGRRYLLGNENHSYKEFMTKVATVVGGRPPLFPLPRTATRAAGLVGRVVSRVDPHKGAGLDRHVLNSMQQDRYRSGRRAVEELGVPTTPLEVAIEKAYRWFVDHGYV